MFLRSIVYVYLFVGVHGDESSRNSEKGEPPKIGDHSYQQDNIIKSLTNLSFNELARLHERGAIPEKPPLGLIQATGLNVFRSRTLARRFNKMYDGDWVFEAPDCDQQTQTLGYLMIKGKRTALGTWTRLEDTEAWKKGFYVDFTQPIKIR
eukprot:Gregarina_sp_Poly_1__2328@NODE_1621_length_3693_cov_115_410645_g1068_i0_p4_GENE_NODE_1621_length_3693_cov_115_410645_g1068_i0NODE_1621_length_3693_cov_115_410645_g1068_i0_p4_ORF_typecomplete_len151_score17_58_NODE_1621_length_3693_cov_115_410645_g1068_i07471199